jgi:predicted nucleotidyltransferase
MFDKEYAIKYTGEFLTACKTLPIKIDEAILFGSAITGKLNEESDIDLALFSGNFTENILQNLDLIAMINIRFPDIDIHTYPTIALTRHGMLLDEIKRTGLEIKL